MAFIGTDWAAEIVKLDDTPRSDRIFSLLIRLITKLVALPPPLIAALFLVRSRIVRWAVGSAYRNRALLTSSGRASRRQELDAAQYAVHQTPIEPLHARI